MKNINSSYFYLAINLLLCVAVLRCTGACDRSECTCRTDSIVAAVCSARAGLTSIPSTFPASTSLLSISSNQIAFIPDDALKTYTELRNLSLQSNGIRFVSYSAFAHNIELINLNLNNNNISELQPETFKSLGYLTTLNLNGNKLKRLHKDLFCGLDNLTTLNIENNEITKIHSSVMDHLPSLKVLSMKGNKIECNCDMAWLKDYSPLSTDVTCFSPPQLARREIRDLSYEELNCVIPSSLPQEEVVQGFRGEQGLELHCLVQGDPKPEVEWSFKGEKLTNSFHYRLSENGSLIILLMLPQLGGEYTCTARNVMGVDTAVIQMVYAGSKRPIFYQVPPSKTHVFVGSSFFLPCEAIEFTAYMWMKEGLILSSDENVIIKPGSGLEVKNSLKSHSGKYYCIAKNYHGEVNVSAVVNVTNAVITCDGIISPNTIEGFRERVNLAFNRTREELSKPSRSPGSLLQKLRFPDSGIIEYLKAAEIFDQAVTAIRNVLLMNQTIFTGNSIPDLSACELDVLARLSGCEERQRVADCSSCFHRKYRTIDGSCNNLDNPLQGAADVPFVRLLNPAYEDGIGLPVGWGGTYPSARKISRDIISANHVTRDNTFTLMLMQFGQFLDHDMDLAPGSPSDIVFDMNNPEMFSSCSDICHNDAPCFPIPIPEDDPRINRQCMTFTRSSAVCGTGASSLLAGNVGVHREQINVITSYIDASNVYSSIDLTAAKLRELNGSGKLLEGDLTASGKKLLPFDTDSLIECSTGINANKSKCFLGGDMRTNEQVGLTSMHTIFYREHNRIVGILTALNPHWDGEKLYQEARKILIAEWQHITFNEYLSKILGADHLAGKYQGYNPNIDATIANSFATAAFRFGHSQIMPLFERLDANYESLPMGPLKLQDAFFAPFKILEEGGIDPLIRGLIATPVKMRLSHEGLNNNLTEALFAQANEIALDLAALNIQRGRDHGLPSYNKWRAYCNLSTPSSIEGLQEHITNPAIRTLLTDTYGDNPDNIDLWVGGLLEDPLPGTQLGPTFLCIIGGQFEKLRDGDRFYYERQGQFTPDQLVQIKQASLSRVICDNADNIDRVPADAFILQDISEFVSCNELPSVDLSLWKECSSDCESKDRTKRSALFKSETNMLEELNLKVSLMEEKIGICKFNGAFYNNGQSWKLSKCTKCSCLNGEVQCEGNNCDATINQP